MATNRKQASDQSVMLAAPVGGVVSGSVYRIGSYIGVAGETAAAGELFTLFLEGIFALAAQTADTYAAGDPVYYDETTATTTGDAARGYPVGICSAAKTSGSATVDVRLQAANNPAIETFSVADDDSAASNGTALKAVHDPVSGVFLNSNMAGAADTTVDSAEGNDYLAVDHNGTPAGVQVYFDEDAAEGSKLLIVSPLAKDAYLRTGVGRLVKLKHDAAAATAGVAVYIDDNAADATLKLLFVSPTNASGSFTCAPGRAF